MKTTDMKKKLKGGKICVIYSPGYGAGWYSWHGITALLFDPTVVEMIERDAEATEIVEYCTTAYGDECYLAADDLAVAYVDTDDSFYIDEYDGAESVVLKSTFEWISAS